MTSAPAPAAATAHATATDADAPRVRAEPDHMSPAFFRGTLATLIVGGLLCLGVFGAVSWSGSVSQTGGNVPVIESAP